ncbi:CLI_3235 family bacteriocin precursor [Clostridium felsineum]|uniref:Uncharacterized protein n=1 Tax=Clostridium felsineum TaxID=36839 RepID=A0A1S8MEQ1_9CLOT|nr:CLI_3235 family bacteriocin precursor [Clostridium felsineum]URZ07464.1 hypothetical protein CLROS_028020 [Clostridium felsineum]URZ12495.1 hypothetical protein CROST_032170 [Clostridium felsineum]
MKKLGKNNKAEEANTIQAYMDDCGCTCDCGCSWSWLRSSADSAQGALIHRGFTGSAF